MTIPFTIRTAQMDALRAPRMEDYLVRAARHIASVFPDQAARVRGPEGRELLEHLVARAREYRLYDEHSITLFMDLCFGLGYRFDHVPEYVWITDLLSIRGLGATARMYLIYKQLPSRCPGPPRGARVS